MALFDYLPNALDVSLDYLLKNGKNRVAGKISDTELIDQFIQVDTLPEKIAISSKRFWKPYKKPPL